MKKLLFLLFILALGLQSYGQAKSHLVVFKPGNKKRYEYHIGDYIVLRQVRDFPTLRGSIYALSDSAIYLGPGDSILFENIASVVIDEDTRVFPKHLWLTNLISTTGAIGLWQVVYLVNTGELSPDIKSAPYIIGFVTLTPIIVNRIAVAVRRSECSMDAGWQLATVSMP